MSQTMPDTADVVIVGAGITGIISAYMLSEMGKKVVIIEKDKVAAGATSKTTAFITQVIDTTYSELLKIFTLQDAQLIINSHQAAVKLIANIIKKEKIQCDFTFCPHFIYANTPKEFESLEKEFKAAKKLGVDIKLVKQGRALGFKNYGYLEVKNQAKFNVFLFIQALHKKLKRNKVFIFEKTIVKNIDSNGREALVTTSSGTMKAAWAIIATYEPFDKPLKLFFKKAFYTSYVLRAFIPQGILEEAIYEDTKDPYHYFRIDKIKNKSTIIIGGEDHRSDIHVSPKKNFAALEEYMGKILQGIPYKISEKWTGPILEPVDGLAYIGPLNKDNILYAMAFSGNGMTYAAISASIMRDYIFKKKNIWAKIYSADRVPTLKSLLIKGKDYTEEFIHGALRNSLRK
jgi:glycine/D-amino acid oxidase-like deaminating enzyme